MKTLSLKELQKEAQKYFEQYGVNVLYATEDGQIFLLAARAQAHAGSGKVHKIEREDVDYQNTDATINKVIKPLSAKEIIASLATITDHQVITQMLNDEVGGANRKSVTEALEKKLQELVAALEPPVVE